MPVPTLLVGAPFPAAQENLPPVCAALDTMEERAAMAPPFEQTGDVLVAFYSDNLLSSLEYTLACAPAVLDEGRLEALEASAAGLRARKEALAAFGERFTVSFDDYLAKKAALDEAEARMRREYLPRLREFGLPEDVACFEGEPFVICFYLRKCYEAG